jgi:pantoate--beta-alanine ligase
VHQLGFEPATPIYHFPGMQVVTSVAAMQRLARRWQRRGAKIGFVPTMGYLHAGHLSLVENARRHVGKRGKVAVSIYVNPTQFGPKEDFSKYPRDLKNDLRLCRAAGVDVVFAPDDAQMYPRKAEDCYSTYVVEEQLSKTMEGASRPTHFRGVTTIVAKLFHIVQPDVAVFGQKDFQQAAIVKRMVSDLNFPLKLVIAPTVRESDGLALSSRNRYLDAAQREQATVLHRSIQRARSAVKRKAVAATRLKSDSQRFISTAPLARLDYVEFFDPDTLVPARIVSRGMHMALAVFFGRTRLIDNGRL